MSTRRPTIADVAREAGVAPSTASVVFSGKTSVSPATKARVRAAAEVLGYAGPDPLAASLRRGRSGIVGVVFEEHLRSVFSDPVKILTMDGLTDGVGEVGAGLLLLRDHDPADTAPTLTTAPMDAAVLIGCSPLLRESLEAVRARGIPVVVIEGDAGDGVPRILLDNREAQRRAATHLQALGHTDVVIVTLPLTSDTRPGWITPDAEVRIDVTRERLAGARDVFPEAPIYAAGGSLIDEGFAAGRAIFADAAHTPTAIIAQSDLLAAGIVHAAREAGMRVPEDVSVTGFDGVDVDGIAPAELATLVQPAVDKGRAAGRAVTAMLEGRAAESLTLTCEFREGNTTAPPR